MVDFNRELSAFNFSKLIRKPLRILTEIILLIAFTIVIYTFLLYSVRYVWIVYSATQVGQSYAKMHEESFRLTTEFINMNFISMSINLTLTSCVICLIAGAVFKFLHINKFLYSNRGIFTKIIFVGLPLTCVVAIYMHYTGKFRLMETALMAVSVPTLCVFTGCFRFSEEFIPELIDVTQTFRKKDSAIKIMQKKDFPRKPKGLIKNEDTKQKKSSEQLNLQNIWNSYATYIIFMLTVVVVAGILNIISRTPNINKKDVHAPAEAPIASNSIQPAVMEQDSAPLKAGVDATERFVAYPDKIILDTKTNLMWAAEESVTLSWDDAQKYCRKFRGGGYKDWRMPSLKELEGLYDPGKQPDCGCVTHLIEMYDGPNCWEWSSKNKDTEAAFFAFNLNGEQWLPKSNNSSVHIRPVRSKK